MKKPTRHMSKTKAIKNDIFDCRKTEHTTLFKRSKKSIINYISREGSKDPILIAAGMEICITPVIPVKPMPLLIEDPSNLGQIPPAMIRDPTKLFI